MEDAMRSFDNYPFYGRRSVGIAALLMWMAVGCQGSDHAAPTSELGSSSSVAWTVGGGLVVTGADPSEILQLPRSVGGVRGNEGIWTSVTIRYGDPTRGVSFTWDPIDQAPTLAGALSEELSLKPDYEAILFRSDPGIVWVQWTEGDYVLTVEGIAIPEADVISIARRTRFDPSRARDVGSDS